MEQTMTQMEPSMIPVFSFATLFDPEQARAAAAQAARWNLPRRECHPLDCYRGRRVNDDVAAYDAQVECGPVPVAADDENLDLLNQNDASHADEIDRDDDDL